MFGPNSRIAVALLDLQSAFGASLIASRRSPAARGAAASHVPTSNVFSCRGHLVVPEQGNAKGGRLPLCKIRFYEGERLCDKAYLRISGFVRLILYIYI